MKNNPTFLFILLVIFSLTLFFFDKLGFLSSLRALEEVGIFLGTRVRSITKNDLGGKLLENESSLENQRLKREIDDLQNQLGAGRSTYERLLVAKVISTGRAFIIDKGQEDGVRMGNTVIVKNILVGKVSTVSKRTSRVSLPIDRDSVIEVLVPRTSAKGLVKGQGNQAILSEVTFSETIGKKDLVETIGNLDQEGLGIRPHLLIGEIETIRKKSDALYQEANLIPLIDYKALETVFIIL